MKTKLYDYLLEHDNKLTQKITQHLTIKQVLINMLSLTISDDMVTKAMLCTVLDKRWNANFELNDIAKIVKPEQLRIALVYLSKHLEGTPEMDSISAIIAFASNSVTSVHNAALKELGISTLNLKIKNAIITLDDMRFKYQQIAILKAGNIGLNYRDSHVFLYVIERILASEDKIDIWVIDDDGKPILKTFTLSEAKQLLIEFHKAALDIQKKYDNEMENIKKNGALSNNFKF